MISKILSWLVGGGISAIGKQLNQAYQNKLNAKNNSERIEADIIIEQLQARQSVLIAEQGNWKTSWIRPVIAFPFAFHIWKVVIWDNALQLGTTPPLSERMAEVMFIVLGAYFLGRSIEKGIKSLRR